MKSGVVIFASGKGGVGKTPLSLTFILALSKLRKNVVALDYNFHNPDLYEILRRFEIEEIDLIDKIGEKRLIPPLILSTIKTSYGGYIYNVSRIEKYRYAPFTSEHLFKSILAIREYIGVEEVFFIVDTNANPISLSIVDVEGAKTISRCEEKFDRINLAYLVTPSVFSRRIGEGDLSELDLLEKSINFFGRYGIKFLGMGGENIIYFFTPTIFDEEKFYSGFVNYLKSRFSKFLRTRKNYIDLSKLVSPTEGLKELLNLSMVGYSRSTYRADIKKLKELRKKFLDTLYSMREPSKEFLSKIDASDIQNIFFSILLESLYDEATKTFPRNTLIIPFVVKTLIGFVDTILLAEDLDVEYLFDKISPISQYLLEWVKNVYLKGL